MKTLKYSNTKKTTVDEMKALVLRIAALCAQAADRETHELLPSYGTRAPQAKRKYQENEALGTAEAADYLGLSPKTLENWRVRGGGPQFMKMGSRCLYSVQGLNDFKKSNARNSTSQS